MRKLRLFFRPIDSFVATVRGQYQFKTAEVTSDLSAAMFFGGIASIEYTKQIAINLASSRYYSDFAIVHHSRLCN